MTFSELWLFPVAQKAPSSIVLLYYARFRPMHGDIHTAKNKKVKRREGSLFIMHANRNSAKAGKRLQSSAQEKATAAKVVN